MKKQMSILMAFLVMWSMMAVPALAADNQAFINSYYQEEESTLNIICSMPDAAQNGTFTVTVAGEEVPVSDVTAIGEAETAKTIYCMVDISGTMFKGMDEIKEVLRTVAAGLGSNDNMVIAQFGNELTPSAFLTDTDAIESEIDALSAYHEQDTNLYQCIMDAISFLQTNQSVNEMACMIILSDGIDAQTSGATLTEALNAVAAADIPIYTVAPNLDESDNDEVEGAKILGSFARTSAGGVHFPKSEDGGSGYLSMTGEEIGSEILADINASIVVKVDLSEVEKADAYIVEVAYDDGAGSVYKDSVQLASTDLTLPEAETTSEETTTEETATEAPTETPATTEETTTAWYDSVPAGAWIGIGAAVLALLILIVVLAALSAGKKKKREQAEAERRRKEREAKAAKERAEQQRKERERQEQERQRQMALQQREEEKRRRQEAYERLPKLELRFVVLGKKNTSYTVKLAQGIETSFGQSGDVVLRADDLRLKPVHFMMLWTGKKVYMWDATTENGTSHNGVVINTLGRVAVEPGDMIRAGGTEYRVYWEE